jgi:type VI secretion system secreted protein Hcp
MTMQSHVPSRRSVLAGAVGMSALAGAAAGPASAALGDPAIPSDPDVAFFLNVAGIAGSATARGFEGQIELLTWAWGVDSSAGTGSGSGSGAGKPTPREFVALAVSDVQSPLLLLITNNGHHLQTVQLSCVRRPRRPITFMTIKLEDVILTSYAVTPDPTDGRPLDLVHVQFRKITQSVIPQNPDGSAGTPVTTSFDYLALKE